MRQLRSTAYSSTAWKKARQAHLVAHPICEECLKEGRVYAGDGDRGTLQVHHINGFIRNGQVNWNLFLDDSNLETICAYHHGLEHSPKEQNAEDILKQLDALFDEAITDEELEANDNISNNR